MPVINRTDLSTCRFDAKHRCTGRKAIVRRCIEGADGDALVGNAPERIAVACSSGASKAAIHMNENGDRKSVLCT